MESALYRIFTLVSEVSEISPTHVKIPYARAFHEVISLSRILLDLIRRATNAKLFFVNIFSHRCVLQMQIKQAFLVGLSYPLA